MIAAFVYDFPHAKTVNGLLALKTAGFDDVICLAAPKKELSIPHSKIRITPITEPLHPRQVAQALGFIYEVTDHDSDLAKRYLEASHAGVILGARVLKKHITDFLPIINLHPGWLPNNRGLDNIKWAIWNGYPQAITAHVIDGSIDRGRLIERQIIDVYEDDTMLDIFIRMQSKEQHMLISSVKKVLRGEYNKERLGEGNYFSAMDEKREKFLPKAFENYKKIYSQIKEKSFKC